MITRALPLLALLVLPLGGCDDPPEPASDASPSHDAGSDGGPGEAGVDGGTPGDDGAADDGAEDRAPAPAQDTPPPPADAPAPPAPPADGRIDDIDQRSRILERKLELLDEAAHRKGG